MKTKKIRGERKSAGNEDVCWLCVPLTCYRYFMENQEEILLLSTADITFVQTLSAIFYHSCYKFAENTHIMHIQIVLRVVLHRFVDYYLL